MKFRVSFSLFRDFLRNYSIDFDETLDITYITNLQENWRKKSWISPKENVFLLEKDYFSANVLLSNILFHTFFVRMYTLNSFPHIKCPDVHLKFISTHKMSGCTLYFYSFKFYVRMYTLNLFPPIKCPDVHSERIWFSESLSEKMSRIFVSVCPQI